MKFKLHTKANNIIVAVLEDDESYYDILERWERRSKDLLPFDNCTIHADDVECIEYCEAMEP